MNKTTEFTAEWHLTHSRPECLLSYIDLAHPFVGQINRLITRFRDVQFLCDHANRPETLLSLRDALAFHLVKMSRWWSFDFCPRSILEMPAPRFLGYVKNHLSNYYEDDTLYDIFTIQRHIRPGSIDDVLVVGKNPPDVVFGVDGQRRFRSGILDESQIPVWNATASPDFAGAWLASRASYLLANNDHDGARDASLARTEHEETRLWHQRYFHACCERHIFTLYNDARKQLQAHRSSFGRLEGEAIVNSLAFRVARFAVHSGTTIMDLIKSTSPESRSAHDDNMEIERRARTHVFTSVDETRQTVQLAVVDRLNGFRPRHCH